MTQPTVHVRSNDSAMAVAVRAARLPPSMRGSGVRVFTFGSLMVAMSQRGKFVALALNVAGDGGDIGPMTTAWDPPWKKRK